MSKNIQFTSSNQLKTAEFDREFLSKKCSLNQRQLPLLATLVGNDVTNKYSDQLYNFARQLGPLRTKFQNYVRRFGADGLSNEDLGRISHRILGNNDMADSIRESIDSYNTDFTPATIDDPFERKLLKTSIYRPYMGTISETQDITMHFYDMYPFERGIKFSSILVDWLKRRIGVLRYNGQDDSYKFTLLAKKRADKPYMAHIETPIYPECTLTQFSGPYKVEFTHFLQILVDIPTLDRLYLGEDDEGMIEIKWKIFGWITSLSDEVISTMRKLPKKFLLICAILYALVKVRWMWNN